jgi:excisionase family DNA binding protein
MAATANSNGNAAPVGRDFLTLREAVKLTNCHENTIRRASDSGELKAYRLPSGHRRWSRSDIFNWLGIEDFKPAEQAAAYNNSILLCSFRDRLARFGTELVLTICKHHNIEVVFTEKEMDESQEKELADDVLAVVTHFSARVHGARASKTTTKVLAAETISLIKQLYDSGQSIPQIVSYLKAEKIKAEDGAAISYHCISKYLNNKLLQEILPTRPTTNLQDYAAERLVAAEPRCRIATADIYADYLRWCKARNQPAAKINKLSHLLGQLGYSRSYAVGEKRIKGYAAVRIKGENKHQYLKQIRKGSETEKLLKQT